jgi:hypothetical protein
MDTARAADQSWADWNWMFRRPWRPPEKPALDGTRNGADFSDIGRANRRKQNQKFK